MCWTSGQFAIKVNCKHTEYQGLCQLLDFKCHLLSTQKQDRDAEEVHRSSISLLSTMLVIGFVGVGGHFLSSVFGRGHSKHFYQPCLVSFALLFLLTIQAASVDGLDC